MSEFFRELIRNLDPARTWWVWDRATATGWDWCYRGFNLFEGLCWLVFAVLVFRRWHHNRRSSWELVYAAGFVAFGLTDFREAWAQSTGLVLVKGVVLGCLMTLRYRAIRVWYPGSRLY
jgi:hypothetical protein